jgi:gluconolactonase
VRSEFLVLFSEIAMKSLHAVSVIVALIAGGCASTRQVLPASEAVKPVVVTRVPSYSEGVVFGHDGKAYVSVCNSGYIAKIDVSSGKAEEFARTPVPNGHKILADGKHLVCDGPSHAVLLLSKNGEPMGRASDNCEGHPLRAPNDLTLDTANSGFYFSDPGGSGKATPIGTVHYVDSAGVTHLVDSGMAFPNGIVLTPDGKRLYVDESQYNRVWVYDVVGPGKVANKRVFANLPAKAGDQIDNQPDGMCLDEAGNLYVAHYGMHQVQVLSPAGELIRRYETGMMTTSNVAFGGPRHDQLFVTGAFAGEKGSEGGLVRLDLGVKGQVILPGEK